MNAKDSSKPLLSPPVTYRWVQKTKSQTTQHLQTFKNSLTVRPQCREFNPHNPLKVGIIKDMAFSQPTQCLVTYDPPQLRNQRHSCTEGARQLTRRRAEHGHDSIFKLPIIRRICWQRLRINRMTTCLQTQQRARWGFASAILTDAVCWIRPTIGTFGWARTSWARCAAMSGPRR